MSSPIHHPEDLDAALMYAPPWARDGARDRAHEQLPPLAPVGPATALSQETHGRRRFGRIDRAFSGDLAMVRMQRQLALNPDNVPEPVFDDEESLWPLAGRIGAVVGVAALIAWIIISLPGARLKRSDFKAAEAPPAPISVSEDKADSAHAEIAMTVQHEVTEGSQWPRRVVTQKILPQDVVPPPQVLAEPYDSVLNAPPFMTPPPAPDIAHPPANGTTLGLDRDELATLVRRGKDFLSNGDFAAARLLLRRAAQAGSADAALALGATYDPLVLRRMGAIGAKFDISRARQWYQKAAALGSEAASQQLAKLELANQ